MPFPRLRGRAILSSLLVWCTAFVPLSGAFATEPSPQVLIGEVQWSGSSRSTADEWLEVWNIGTEPVNLAGWSLVGASDNPIYFASTTILNPQQTLLVANYPATSDKTLLTAQTIAIATSSLSLSNDHLLIELRDQTGATRDTAGTGARPPAGASTPTNTSMIRTRSVSGWGWKSATSTFFVGALDLGSPGVCDECQLTTSTIPGIPTTPTTTSTQVIGPETPIEEPPLLEPEEADLYGVTPTDVTEEQAESPTPSDEPSEPPHLSPYESPTLGTSPSTLPEIPETPSTSSSVLATSTNEVGSLEEIIVAPTSTITVTSSTEVATTSSSASEPTQVTPVVVIPPVIAPLVVIPSTPPLNPPSFDPVITEIMAAPATDDTEWIELRLPDTASPLRYINWKLEADGKSVFAFTTAALQALNPQGNYLLLAWKSAKLKNTGATLRLKRADGTIAQEVRYGNSLKGTSWIRDELSTSWNLTRHPTKGAPNILEAVAPTPVTQKTVAVAPTKTTIAKATQASSTSTAQKRTASVPKRTGDVKSLELAAKTKSSTASATAIKEKKTAANKPTKAATTPKNTIAKPPKKPSTKKSLILPSSVTHFEQIPPEQLSPKVRVRLQGLVGSTVGVFGKQKFVLLAPDGRGLLVKTTTDQPSPTLGATIEITGLLFANDEGVQLQMQTGDLWKAVPNVSTTSPRLVDWNAPGLEDQWSFTKLEGLVTDSRSTAIVLESQIGEVTIPIKAIVGYRAQRVKTGDTIEVSGIFDGRSGLWKIQPSKATDIVILKHPEPETKTAATSPSNTNLPWNAIGIAIGSIGAVEGIRRWLEKRKATLQPKATPATILGA